MRGPADAPVRLDTVDAAVAEIAAGRPVVVIDDRGDEGDLIIAADAVTPEWMAFVVRHTSGVVCVPMTGAALDRLGIPLMVPENEDRMQTAFAVSVDAADGVTTGISARDRAHTARLLADPHARADDVVRPGHVLPVRARDGGVLERRGHTEAAVDLARLAGREPVGVIAELVGDDGSMRRAVSCRAFADAHQLVMISIEDLRQYRLREQTRVRRLVTTRMPTRHGLFTAVGYAEGSTGDGHLALVAGLGVDGRMPDAEDVLVRVHTECLTGEVLGSTRCGCGPQLDAAIEQIAASGRGVLVYLRGHEGRGSGFLANLQAYALQDQGFDTVDAGTRRGLPVDAGVYRAAADILADLGVRSARLLSDDPVEAEAVRRNGVHVSVQVPLVVGPHSEDPRHLATGRDRLGHGLAGLLPPEHSAHESRRSPSVMSVGAPAARSSRTSAPGTQD